MGSREEDVLHKLRSVGNTLETEHNLFKSMPLKDYDRLNELNEAIDVAKEVCDEYAEYMKMWNIELKKIREKLMLFPKTTMTILNKPNVKKNTPTITSQDVTERATEAKLVAQKKENFAAIAEAQKLIAELVKRLAELQQEATKSGDEAHKASMEAKRVQLQLEKEQADLERKLQEAREEEERRKQKEEEDRLREEERKREEEERKKREEEERIKREREEEEAKQREEEQRRIEEEEQLRREEEEKKRREEEEKERIRLEAERKAEEERKRIEEDERRKIEEEERKRREAEEQERQRKEAERRNPHNWPRWDFPVIPNGTDIDLGCCIRAIPGSGITEENITVESVSQLTGVLSLQGDESLVSNIVHIAIKDNHTPNQSKEEEDNRNNYDPVAEHKETISEDKHKRIDNQINEPLSISFPHCIRQSTKKKLIVKKLEENGHWIDLKTVPITFDDLQDYNLVECRSSKVSTFAVVLKTKEEEFIINSSGGEVKSNIDSRVYFVVKKDTFADATTINLEVQPVDQAIIPELREERAECSELVESSPIMGFQTNSKRYRKKIMANVPMGIPNKKSKNSSGIVREGRTMLLVQETSGYWKLHEDITLTDNNENIMFEFDKPIKRFMILRCKETGEKLPMDKMASAIVQAVNEHKVNFILRQHEDNLNKLAVVGALREKVEEENRMLQEEGFITGPEISDSFLIREGEICSIRFRGNIIPEENKKENRFVFNSQLLSRLKFGVQVEDTFAQKQSPKYYGFAQLYREDRKEQLAELVIYLPKVAHKSYRPVRVGFKLRKDDFITETLLEYIAGELEEEEWESVAKYLQVPESRLPGLLNDYESFGMDRVAKEMLLMWVKTKSLSANKANELVNALIRSGRNDLAENVRSQEREFNNEQAKNARDYHLKNGFRRCCQETVLTHKWRSLGKHLKVPEDTLNSIDINNSTPRAKCDKILFEWRELMGDNATPEALVKAVRQTSFPHIADNVAQAMKPNT